MRVHPCPVSIRLLGFPCDEGDHVKEMLARAPGSGPAYFCLLDDSLQEPDVVIANGDEIAALATVAVAPQPAVVVGPAVVELPCPRIERPLAEECLFALLAELAAQQRARDTQPFVHERRRRPRPDFDLTDPALYLARRRARPCGTVLIVDKGGAFRDHVARVMAGRGLAIEWTDSPATAVRLCDETPVSVVMINTSAPGLDPYGLGGAIKAQHGAEGTAVMLLASPAFGYDSGRARAAGVRGLLDKPVADRHLVAALGKLMSLPR